MSKPAYFVEGVLEQRFIQSICSGAPVRLISCNGNSVNINAIAERVGTLARLLHKRYSPLVVIMDRESRLESAQELCEALQQSLLHERIDAPVVVGVPDRNIECWILADFERFAESANIETALERENYEGCNGKAAIKRLLPRGKKYVETIDGVAWLKAARPAEMALQSPSFLGFLKKIQHFRCWWVAQTELSFTNGREHFSSA